MRGLTAFGRSGLNVWIPVEDESTTLLGLRARRFEASAGQRFRLQSPPAIRVTSATLEPPEAGRFADALQEVLRRGSPPPPV